MTSAIRALEHELDVVLFDRDRHRVALTDAGRVLLPEARATLAAAQAARDAIHEVRAGLRGTLTIGTMQSTGRLDLPALLGQFYASGKSGAGAITGAASGRTLLTFAQSLLCGEEALMDLSLRGSRVLITGGTTARQHAGRGGGTPGRLVVTSVASGPRAHHPLS